MKKIKIAQIGTSYNSHGSAIWPSLVRQKDIFDVVGYAFPENEREKFPERAEVFAGAREMTVEEILSDPEIEAVTVETEEIYLTKYALMAARAGKHIHMEKPGGCEKSDFEELVRVLKEKNLVFSIGYMFRHNPKIKEALEKVKNGNLGKIFSAEAQMSCPQTLEVREWLDTFRGGMMFYLGCHLVDLVYRIQGEPREVIPLNCSTGLDGVKAEDFGMALFKYDNGVSFVKTNGCERGGNQRRELVICGEKGTIEIRPLEVWVAEMGLQYTPMRETYTLEWHRAWDESKSELHDRYDGMMRNFAEMIRGKENPYTYDYELNLYKLILKACGQENI